MTLHYTDLNRLADIAPSSRAVATTAKKQRGLYRNGFKRAFDTVLIVMALPFILPLMILMALAVASDGGRPFYTQLRIGRDGRHFRMWKLRTMVSDADLRLQEYLMTNPEAHIEWNTTQKLKRDPRITRVGRLLRKSSLDELPQLWNVLNGSMSLVGPRPMMVEQQSFYDGQCYYNLAPGITGYWQVSDRNEGTFCQRVKHDDAYDKDVSLKTDIKILMRTFGVVLRCTGY